MTAMAKPVAVSSFLWVIFWWMPGRIVVHVKKKKIVFSFFFYVVNRNKGGIESLLSG